jgi:ABC-type proline/glycine betaine transport system ATPase subunit
VSVLFVTHNIDEAIFLAQRVVMAAHPGSIRADIAIELPPAPARIAGVRAALCRNRVGAGGRLRKACRMSFPSIAQPELGAEGRRQGGAVATAADTASLAERFQQDSERQREAGVADASR